MSTAESVQQIFTEMPNRLNPSAAQGLDCVIQYDLTGEGARQFHTKIKDGAATVCEGPHPSPSMTITMAAQDFVDLTGGKLDGMSAFMSGKLRIGGDMGLAMKLQSLFRGP
jgi:putative sterol carrier protein